MCLLQEIDLHNDNLYLRAKVLFSRLLIFFYHYSLIVYFVLLFCMQSWVLPNLSVLLYMQISDNEKAQHNMNVLPGNVYEAMTSAPYDARNFLQVNLPDTKEHPYCSGSTALQLW